MNEITSVEHTKGEPKRYLFDSQNTSIRKLESGITVGEAVRAAVEASMERDRPITLLQAVLTADVKKVTAEPEAAPEAEPEAEPEAAPEAAPDDLDEIIESFRELLQLVRTLDKGSNS